MPAALFLSCDASSAHATDQDAGLTSQMPVSPLHGTVADSDWLIGPSQERISPNVNFCHISIRQWSTGMRPHHSSDTSHLPHLVSLLSN